MCILVYNYTFIYIYYIYIHTYIYIIYIDMYIYIYVNMFHDVIHQIAIKFPIDPVLKTTFVRPRLDGKPWRHPLSFFFQG